jgi:ELWxxDGT repeat protein
MKTKQLLALLLLCHTALFLCAQPDQRNLKLIPELQSGQHLLPRYDSVAHQVVWTVRDQSPRLQANQTSSNAVAGSNYHLVKDINTTTDSYPGNYSLTQLNPQYAVLNNITYFGADDGLHGSELWRSDGTAAGTYLVKDINPGTASAGPWQILVANGKLYFTAVTAGEGSELWTSDGTTAGTQLLKDIIPGEGSGNPINLFSVGNTIYFTTNGEASYDNQLWKTDGTAAGTVQLKDLYTAADNYSNNILQMASANGLLYFTAYSNTIGRELWRSDGTPAGTFMIRDINPNVFGDYDGPAFLTAYNNHLYFVADDGVGRKLWLTDGTNETTCVSTGGQWCYIQ